MARLQLGKQTADRAGSAVTFDAVSAAASPDGNYFDSDGSEIVLIKNTGVSPHTMTVDVAVVVDGAEVPDRVVTVPAGETVQWRPQPEHRQTNGQVHLNFDDAVDVTVAILDS